MTLKDLSGFSIFEYSSFSSPASPRSGPSALSEDEYLKAQDEYGQDSFTANDRRGSDPRIAEGA